MQTRYVIHILCKSIVDVVWKGNVSRSVLVELQWGTDRVDKSKFEEWFVEGCLVCCSRCKYYSTRINHETNSYAEVQSPRIMSYCIICEGLKTVEGVMDTIECFHQMTSELTEESIM